MNIYYGSALCTDAAFIAKQDEILSTGNLDPTHTDFAVLLDFIIFAPDEEDAAYGVKQYFDSKKISIQRTMLQQVERKTLPPKETARLPQSPQAGMIRGLGGVVGVNVKNAESIDNGFQLLFNSWMESES